MSTATCDHCSAWIDGDQRQHPGYCSTKCRDGARNHQRTEALKRAEDRAKHRKSQIKTAPRIHYLT